MCNDSLQRNSDLITVVANETCVSYVMLIIVKQGLTLKNTCFLSRLFCQNTLHVTLHRAWILKTGSQNSNQAKSSCHASITTVITFCEGAFRSRRLDYVPSSDSGILSRREHDTKPLQTMLFISKLFNYAGIFENPDKAYYSVTINYSVTL